MRLIRSAPAPWLALALVTLLLLIPIPGAQRWPSLTEALLNFCHPLAFAWLSHLAFVVLRADLPAPSRRPYLLVLGAAAAYGGAIEVVQAFVGRQASWLDLANDVVGVAFALLLHARAEHNAIAVRRGLLVAAGACVLMALLPLSLTLAAYAHRAQQAPVLWREATPTFLQFAIWQQDEAPGLFIHEIHPAWKPWRNLEIDISNPLQAPLQVVVRVNDRFHDYKGPDRWARPYALAPQSRTTLRIPLDEIERNAIARPIALDAVRGLMILGGPHGRLPPFIVHEIRLASRR